MTMAVCPGSFDPITNGHIDVIQRSAQIFDKVIILVMDNYRKRANQTFTAEERVELIEKSTRHLNNVAVDEYDGLLAQYCENNSINVIIKGLRAVSDYEDEFQQALTNSVLNPDVETVFMAASSDNMFLSSSVVRQVCELGGDISAFVPPEILDDIVKRLRK
jgi:pantetheine-phosphate adenylyltransferase